MGAVGALNDALTTSDAANASSSALVVGEVH